MSCCGCKTSLHPAPGERCPILVNWQEPYPRRLWPCSSSSPGPEGFSRAALDPLSRLCRQLPLMGSNGLPNSSPRGRWTAQRAEGGQLRGR